MKANNGNSFQALLEKFFLQRLMKQQGASPETVKSYRDTFRLYIKYLDSCHSILPTSIMIEHLGAEYTLGFLDDLAVNRNNQPKTINNRLAAIHAFLHFLSFEVPEYSSVIAKNLMIPFRKEEKRQMDFVTKEEFEALLHVCDTKTNLGCRDELMLLLLYNSGIRVSEMLGLHGRDIIWSTGSSTAYIHVTGKGRKERNIPLWKSTSKRLSLYMRVHKVDSDTKLFINYSGEELTRSGVRYRLQCLVNEASKSASSLKRKNISPHTFRHYGE